MVLTLTWLRASKPLFLPPHRGLGCSLLITVSKTGPCGRRCPARSSPCGAWWLPGSRLCRDLPRKTSMEGGGDRGHGADRLGGEGVKPDATPRKPWEAQSTTERRRGFRMLEERQWQPGLSVKGPLQGPVQRPQSGASLQSSWISLLPQVLRAGGGAGEALRCIWCATHPQRAYTVIFGKAA